MSESDRKAMGLLLEVLDTPKERRGLLLDARCGVDTPLRIEVERLLALSESDDSFLLPPIEKELALGSAPDRPERLGEFILCEEIGRGGMGVVYRARQESLARDVALKVITAPPASQRQIESFHREARSISRLDHPGLLPVYTDGRDGPFHYYAMELVDGHDLRQELARQREGATPEDPENPTILPPFASRQYVSAAVQLVIRVASALHHAHQHGIIHRDVKPHNILVRRDGRPQLVDFGLARDAAQTDVTRSQFGGTYHYMSPEQIRGRARGASARPGTDVFSLGVVLFEVLTLRRPFEGEGWEAVLQSILRDEPPRLRRLQPRLPRDLAAICEKALEKDDRRRYPTAAALAEDLERFLHLETPLASQQRWTPARVWRFLRRHRVAVFTILLVSIALLLGSTLTSQFVRQRDVEAKLSELRRLERLDWNSRDSDRALLEGQKRLEELATMAGFLGASEQVLVGRLNRRFEALEAELEREVRARVGAATPSENEGTFDPLDRSVYLERAESLQLADRLARLFPSTERRFNEVAEQVFWASVDVRAVDETGELLEGRAFFREIDRITGLPGQREELGPLPLKGARIPPGYHRIVVEVPGRGFRELSRVVWPKGEVSVVAELRSGHDPNNGMVFIPGGVMELPEQQADDLVSCPNLGRRLEIPGFRIDPCEVTVREYREYFEATDATPPLHWDLLPQDGSADELPVVYVSWEEARAYAEWAGKRLVSHPEFDWAARGPEGRFYPWGESGQHGNTLVERTRRSSSADYFLAYLEEAARVGSHSDAATPEGVQDLFGNAEEWSESVVAEWQEGRWISRNDRRFLLGDTWDALTRVGSLEQHSHWVVGKGYKHYTRGFRCGRSVVP